MVLITISNIIAVNICSVLYENNQLQLLQASYNDIIILNLTKNENHEGNSFYLENVCPQRDGGWFRRSWMQLSGVEPCQTKVQFG